MPNLPIVWWLDDANLPTDESRDEKLKKIADAVARWEKDGNRTLNDLKAEINDIHPQS